MKISKAHQKFAESFQNRLTYQRALEHPEEFLGPNWKDVLNFWLFLDTLSEEQMKIVRERYRELNDAAYHSARAARLAAWDSARLAAQVAAGAAAAGAAAGYATWELIGSHIILAQNKSLTFLPMFLNL